MLCKVLSLQAYKTKRVRAKGYIPLDSREGYPTTPYLLRSPLRTIAVFAMTLMSRNL